MYYPYYSNIGEPYTNQNRHHQYIDQINHHNKMTVNGKGEITARPDQAKLTVGVVTENIDVENAQQENAMISTRVINGLKQLGIGDSDIRTNVYSIQPQYDYIDGKSVLRAYQVEHQLEVTVKDIAKVGLVYDQALKAGANRGGNVQFFVSNPEGYYREALKRALHDAIEKAVTISTTIGTNLNKTPIKIVEEPEPQDRIFPVFSYKLAATAEAGVPPIQKGEFRIVANVKAEFKYYTKT
ncbi:SIMPL domain-containing protein [Bacillus sp. T3]|uniref:SIMPL domain-containing protein n=1 Tax=Bacillus sp. T3 TaxID=467262 RepID=UPI0029828A45|nr:SIMPL domain-containing protein [Bacillus sp. T3]